VLPSGPAAPSSSTLRASRSGDCRDCKAGEAAVSVEQVVPPGGSLAGSGAPCAPGADAAVREIAARLTGVAAAGSALQEGGAAAAALAPYAQADAACQVVAAVLPAGARYSGYLVEAADVSGSGACFAGQECEIGRCAWAGHPEVVRSGEATLVFGVFRNASPDRVRRARLTVYFKP
jgi:hypothetical protein